MQPHVFSIVLLCTLAAVAHGHCSTLANLPAPGTALACLLGYKGGGSTSANAPALGPSIPSADYCASYSFQCSPSDSSPACSGQPSGTVARTWLPLSASTAQYILTQPSSYMQPYICSTSGCNTVAASNTCTGVITTLYSCGGSTCNVPPSGPGTGCSALNSAPIILDNSCATFSPSLSIKAKPGTAANTATLTWYMSAACSGSPAGNPSTNLQLGGSPSTGCQAAPTFPGSIYAAGSSGQAQPAICPPLLGGTGIPAAFLGNYSAPSVPLAVAVGTNFVEITSPGAFVYNRVCLAYTVAEPTDPNTVYGLSYGQTVPYFDDLTMGLDRCLAPQQVALYTGTWFRLQQSALAGGLTLSVSPRNTPPARAPLLPPGPPPSDFLPPIFDTATAAGGVLKKGMDNTPFTCPAPASSGTSGVPADLSGTGTPHDYTSVYEGRTRARSRDTFSLGAAGFWRTSDRDAAFSAPGTPFNTVNGSCITAFGSDPAGLPQVQWYSFQMQGQGGTSCLWASQQPAASAGGLTPNNATLHLFSGAACASTLRAQLSPSAGGNIVPTLTAHFYSFWTGAGRPQGTRPVPTPTPNPTPQPPSADPLAPGFLCPALDAAAGGSYVPALTGYAFGEARDSPGTPTQPTLLSFSSAYGLSFAGQLPVRRNASAAYCPTSITQAFPPGPSSPYSIQLAGSLALTCASGTVVVTEQLCYGATLPAGGSGTLTVTNATSLTAIGPFSPLTAPLAPPCQQLLAGAVPRAVEGWVASSASAIPPPFCTLDPQQPAGGTPAYLIGYGRNTAASIPGQMSIVTAWGAVTTVPFAPFSLQRLCLDSWIELGNWTWQARASMLDREPMCETVQRWGNTLLVWLSALPCVPPAQGTPPDIFLADFYSAAAGGSALQPPADPGLYTFSASLSASPSATPSGTPTLTQTGSVTATASPSLTPGASPSTTPSLSPTPSGTPSPTAALTPGACPSSTSTLSLSSTTSASPSPTLSTGASPSATPTPTLFYTPAAAAAPAGAAASAGAAVGGSLGGLLLLAAAVGAAYFLLRGRRSGGIFTGGGSGGGGGWASKSWGLRSSPRPVGLSGGPAVYVEAGGTVVFAAGSSGEATINPLNDVQMQQQQPSYAPPQQLPQRPQLGSAV